MPYFVRSASLHGCRQLVQCPWSSRGLGSPHTQQTQHLLAPKLLQGQAALLRHRAKHTREQQGPQLSVSQRKTIFSG